MKNCIPALLLFLAASAPLRGMQDKKLAVPDAAEQKKAEADIRSVFKEDFAKKDRDSRRALGQKLLAQAGDAANTPAQRYAVLMMARDVSAEALDFNTGFATIDMLEHLYEVRATPLTGATFAVDLNLLKASYLAASKKHAPTPDDVSVIASAFMSLAEGALTVGECDDSIAFADQAAKTSKDAAVIGKAKQFMQEVPPLKAERDLSAKAEAILEKNPDDAEANTAWGRFLLFVKKDEGGLSFLMKGSASQLKDLATAETARPATPEAMLEIGEGWLALSEKDKTNVGKGRYQQRGIHWLELAFQSAGGLTKAKIKKKLADLGRIEEPSSEGLECRWFFDEGNGAVTVDGSPAARKGMLMNGVKWVPGISGSAVGFDGVGSYVSCDGSGLHFANNPQSICWAHQVPSAPKGNSFIISLTNEKSPLILGLGYRDGKITVWKTDMTIVQAPAPPPGEWHSYAYTYDQKVHKLYIDGALKASSTVGTMSGPYRMLEFGRWYGGYPVPNGPPNQFFQGSLDDVRIYKRALEEAEVRDLVRKKKP